MMTADDRPWREFYCRTCDGVPVELRRDGQRTVLDYCTPAVRLVHVDNVRTVPEIWARGIDVSDELGDVADAIVDVQCHCHGSTRTRSLSLRRLVAVARDHDRRRVPLPD